MQKKKLKLEELKVQSFVTELQPDVAHTAKGGDDDGSLGTVCDSVNVSASIVASLHALTVVPKSCRVNHCTTVKVTTTAAPAPL